MLGHAESLGRVGSFRLDVALGTLEWSDGMYRIHALAPEDEPPLINCAMGNVHPTEAAAATQAIETAMALEKPGTSKYRIVRPDGSERHVLVYLQGEYDSVHALTHIVGTLQDITELTEVERERHRLESKVQQAQKLESLGVLAGGIAHDFNNLLMGILGNADLALMDLAPESPARQSIMAIENAAKRAADLARQMLAYSGKGKFLIKRLDLRVLIEEMMHLIKTSVSKRVVLKCEFAERALPIEADVAQIRQVILNLVTNASEAIGERSGAIAIRTGTRECDREYLSEAYVDVDLAEGLYSFVEVSDTGAGMDKETLARVFDPFFTTKFTGRGLGLAAVLGIVRGHRAAIKVYSEPGKGTTFKVLFPANTGPISSVAPEIDERLGERLRGLRVLLVDDEETVRAVGKSMLERLGCDVTCAEDGVEALAIVKKDPSAVDCVLLDLTMPHMDGETCYQELRCIREDMVVILSSGYNQQDLIDRFAGRGLAGFIQKPYKTQKLKETLIKAFGLLDETEEA